MTDKLTWHQALKQFNDEKKAAGGKHSIPRKGSDDYLAVRKLMGDNIAAPLAPDQPLREQMKRPPSKSTGEPKPKAKAKTPSKVQELVETMPIVEVTVEKPLWVDEPKPQPNAKSRTRKLTPTQINQLEVTPEQVKR